MFNLGTGLPVCIVALKIKNQAFILTKSKQISIQNKII